MDPQPQVHELRFVEGEDDDTSSLASFEHYPPRPIKPPGRPKKKGFLKVDGKVPPVVYVLKFIGWNDKVIEYRQSTEAFKNMAVTEEEDGEADDDDQMMGKEKPVLEIITKVFTANAAGGRHPRRRRLNSRGPQDRPITETFDQVDYRYDDCYSEDEADLEVSAPDIARPAMVIHSEHLINALKAVVSYYPYINLEGKAVTIHSPYRVLYHHRRELAHYRDNQPDAHDDEYTATTANHISVLLSFLEKNLGKQITQEEERHQLPTPMATFEYFWLLLKPGEVIYAKRYDIWTPYVISSIRIDQHAYSAYDQYKINCWLLESNGTKVNRYMYSFSVSPWLGEQAIGTLPVVPAKFWPEDLAAQGGLTMRENNIAQGKLYWELLKRPTYMEYDGLLVNSGSGNRMSRGPTGFMHGRVICDAPGFDAFYNLGPDCVRGMPRYHRNTSTQTGPPAKDHLPRTPPRCGCRACAENRSTPNNSPYLNFEDLDPLQDTPPTNELFYLVCSNTIPGFILGDRRWGHLNVANLKPLQTDKEAFKR
ncbi:hypothetical protein G7046_g5869 [Stylonectria norvegica]|nr:hypothetical protein G7046_g5869 [Stylonectria norvegica]